MKRTFFEFDDDNDVSSTSRPYYFDKRSQWVDSATAAMAFLLRSMVQEMGGTCCLIVSTSVQPPNKDGSPDSSVAVVAQPRNNTFLLGDILAVEIISPGVFQAFDVFDLDHDLFSASESVKVMIERACDVLSKTAQAEGFPIVGTVFVSNEPDSIATNSIVVALYGKLEGQLAWAELTMQLFAGVQIAKADIPGMIEKMKPVAHLVQKSELSTNDVREALKRMSLN